MPDIEIVINGESRRVPELLTMQALLEYLEINPATVVVERDRVIYSAVEFKTTLMAANDRVEIVRFMGGG